MTKQLDKDMMRMMSLKDRMKYKADLDKMKRDIADIKQEKTSDEDKWCNYSGMPSPKAYEQKATQSNNYGWVDNEDDDDDYSSSDGGESYDDSNEY